MATQAQIDANRRNAQLSTGPKTPEGKATVSRNALKHGFRSEAYKRLLEDPKDYDELLAGLIAEHQPQTLTEEFYVERMALCLDKLGILEGLQTDHLLFQAQVGPGEEKTLSLYWNQQDRLERAFDRALAALRKLQKDRRAAEKPDPAEPSCGVGRQACEGEQSSPASFPRDSYAPAPLLVAIPDVPIEAGAEPIPQQITPHLEKKLNVA